MVMVVVKTRLVNINSIPMKTLTVLSNNIIIPSLVIAVVSPHCYYNAGFAQSPSAVVSVVSCSFYRFRQNFNRDIDQCLIYDNYEYDATYNAPFHYRYECSAAFSIKFVSIYMYMFMLVSIVLPLFTLSIRMIYNHYDQNTMVFRLEGDDEKGSRVYNKTKAKRELVPWEQRIYHVVSMILSNRSKI